MWFLTSTSIRTAIIAACVIAAVCACGGSSEPRTQTAETSSRGHSPLPARLAPQSAVLRLTKGRSAAQYSINAPSPARYAFDVSADMPRSAALTILLRTSYGAVLTAGEYRPNATSESSTANSERACSVHGPRLHVHRALPAAARAESGQVGRRGFQAVPGSRIRAGSAELLPPAGSVAESRRADYAFSFDHSALCCRLAAW